LRRFISGQSVTKKKEKEVVALGDDREPREPKLHCLGLEVTRSGVGHSVVHPLVPDLLGGGVRLPTAEHGGQREPVESRGVLLVEGRPKARHLKRKRLAGGPAALEGNTQRSRRWVVGAAGG
jgi:hypothetical protein